MSKVIESTWQPQGVGRSDYGTAGPIRQASVQSWARRLHRSYAHAGARSSALLFAGGRFPTGSLGPIAAGAQTLGDRGQDRLLIEAIRPQTGLEVELGAYGYNLEVEIELFDDTGSSAGSILLYSPSLTDPDWATGVATLPAPGIYYAEVNAGRDLPTDPAAIWALYLREPILEASDL